MALPSGLFVSDTIHARDVTLPDGSVHTLHFKELPAVEFRRFQIAETSEDEQIKAQSLGKLIAASVVEPDGKQAMTQKDAMRLNSAAANALMAVILEINGYGERKNG